MNSLSVADFKEKINSGANILDARTTAVFKEGYIAASIHIPFKEKFEEWVKTLLNPEESLLLVAEHKDQELIGKKLTGWGFKNIEGYLQGGFESWKSAGEPVDLIIDVEPDELMMDIPFDDNLIVVDVRKPIEFAEGHLKEAVNIPLQEMIDPLRIAQFEDSDNLYLHCGGGTRSVIASSILKKHGIHNLRNVAGGWSKIKEEPKAEIVKEPDVLN